ncbi:UNVERIFIED_CONTAM: hypothetical protein GTU68_049716, partial [Idotea baltica]|nr:hypothetical protein [Idotea baltica]
VYSEAAKYAADLKESGKEKIVFTNGCFDILHVGHARYLAEARALGDALIVGLNSDSSVKRLDKGEERPIVPEGERAEMLEHLASVSKVFLFSEDTPLELIQAVCPDILVKGGDWAPETIVGNEFVTSHGGLVRSLPFHPGHSTTDIVATIIGAHGKSSHS